jgi:hypothetical protein
LASHAFILIETLLLIGGATLVWWIRADKWTLKASVKSGLDVARRFQPAAELLGIAQSRDFPNMALWKAAQDLDKQPSPEDPNPSRQRELVVQVKMEIAALLENMKKSIRHHYFLERLATLATLAAIAAVIACNLYIVLIEHRTDVELLAVWLPSLIGAIYSFNFRKRTVQHIETIRDFLLQLDFAKVRIYAPTEEDPMISQQLFRANLRLLCKIVALFSQREIQFALADQPQVPM